MHENVRTNNVRNEAHGKSDCCTPDSSAKVASKADTKAKLGENSRLNDAQKPVKAGCCCGFKSPKRRSA